jgi:hypothetical protein
MQGSEGMASAVVRALATSKDPEELLSVGRAAAEIGGGRAAGGVSQATIRRYLTKGLLRRYKFGGRTFVKRGELAALISVE